MTSPTGKKASSRVSEVYVQLRREILAARFAPGEHLHISALRERFGVSLSVVREALIRLAEQRLVRSEPQIGFFVVPLDEATLLDLYQVRIHVETLALRLAIEKAGVPWESSVVAALHTLGRTPQHVAGDNTEMTEDWAGAHAEFHRSLASGCASPLLMDIRAGLYDASELYRRWAQPVVRDTRDVHADHTAIAEAALARDPDRATGLLEQHLRGTADALLAGGLDPVFSGRLSPRAVKAKTVRHQ
ncbi:GntR family transcriptional regulator [Streptomyces sp. NBC_00063]|uniref:GntR family transcriptional regulator n=1 Tax=Streptomyces sp. NBC_00063 TaxID=2975638 RepID=UPI003D703D4E